MKNLVKTTMELNNALDALKIKRMATTSITDKAMTNIAVENIKIGELTGITFYEVVDEETGEVNNQVVFSTDTANYSTCSKVAYGLADDIFDLITSGDINIEEVGIRFSFANSRAGNKFLSCELA